MKALTRDMVRVARSSARTPKKPLTMHIIRFEDVLTSMGAYVEEAIQHPAITELSGVFEGKHGTKRVCNGNRGYRNV